MPFCKKCGTFYPNSLGVCPKCNANDILAEQPPEIQYAEMDEGEAAKHRRRAWIGILIGVPGFIALIYFIYLLMKVL